MNRIVTSSPSAAMLAWLPTPVRFVLAGGVAAAVNFLSRILLGMFMPYALSIVLAFFLGMTAAFLLNRRFVFQSSTNGLRQQVAWFVTVNLMALLQTLAVSLLLADFALPYLGMTRYAETVAHAIGIVVPIFASYLGHKRLTFR